MRLSKIKLAGFKSFVDPTVIPLPSNLIGIVGPNGCGKSNVIDAVRWVMGESSAKHLRGDSMADVVFNGSATRKPVSQATVELIFDNSDGAIGGQYARYAEISIKRTVTRDGVSSYYLNGTRCRRRDITDIFLGTGLGPRSYAIIEQGTISRLIEARPEELRVFIEEAAGISRYKERRRETENRMRHTRENLDRLNDLRDELEKQLNHLQRQARTAERFKALKEEERLTRAQLHALRWRSLNEQAEHSDRAIREQETALEAATAAQRRVEAEMEQQRDRHAQASDRFNEVQSRFYGIGADIARLEQSLQHARERRRQQEEDLAKLGRDGEEVAGQLEADRRRVEEIAAALAQVEPQLAAAVRRAEDSGAALAAAEQAMHDWQERWEAFTARAAEPARRAEVARARIDHLERSLEELRRRVARLAEEQAAQSTGRLETELAQLERDWNASGTRMEERQAALAAMQEQVAALREAIRDRRGRLDTLRQQVQELSSRHASLEALQAAALGKAGGEVQEWLQGQGLGEAPRLAETLDVEPGWERAVECVLGGYLEAVCVDGVEPLAAVAAELAGGTLTLYDTGASAPAPSSRHGLEPLAARVRGTGPLNALLDGVLAAPDLQGALAARPALAAGESVVTRNGIWLGPGWLRVVRPADHQAGVLEREQELKALGAELAAAREALDALQAEQKRDQDRLHELEAEREQAQAEFNRAGREHAELQSRLSAARAGLAKVQERSATLERELEEARRLTQSREEELAAARRALEEALDETARLEREREALQAERGELRARLEEVRAAAAADREAAQQGKVRAETLRTEQASLAEAMQRLEAQLAQLSERKAELEAALGESTAPLAEMERELEALLERRVSIEHELAGAREALEAADQALRELEERRGQAEQAVAGARDKLAQLKLDSQEVRVRRETVAEQIVEEGFSLETLLAEMPAEADEAAWADRLAELERKIQRLGPINLAAIDEYEQQSERKQYLDAQHADLTEALQTLENAIRKIDRETRTRFKETFDQINAGIKRLFPRLFGGGHAYLEMTGDDLLEAGVTVMARPPGKRNSTIHLLSGGEKALTAVALVFAIFELNPAPFCMLDEVDAPLDDANVGRYSEMLKEMSERTQFIFITHNKLTMEIAHQLNGVTMNEPGVSHLVAVDVDKAVEMAAV